MSDGLLVCLLVLFTGWSTCSSCYTGEVFRQWLWTLCFVFIVQWFRTTWEHFIGGILLSLWCKKIQVQNRSIWLGGMEWFINRTLSHVRFWCLFASKKIPNNAEMPQSSILLVVMVDSQDNEYNQALWHHSIIWYLFGDKHQNIIKLRCPI